MHNIFKYHGYLFLKSPPLRGKFKFFFPASVLNKYSFTPYMYLQFYIMPIITLAKCSFIKSGGVHPPMKLPNVTYFRQSDLKYAKNDLKWGKNDLKYYDLKWDFPLGGLLSSILNVPNGCLVVSFLNFL